MIPTLASLIASTSTTVATTKKSSGSILDPIAKPIAWILAHIYAVIPNYGVAILILSVLWMILISPLTLKSTRSMLAMQKLQPKLKALQEKHKDDRQAFAQAQMDLFREHQVSPFGSCLPMLLPMPVFFALFRVIDGLSHTVKGPDPSIHCAAATCYDPKYLSQGTRMFKDIVGAHGHLNAFGMDLSHNAFSAHSSIAAALPFWILLLIMAATSYMQTAQTMSRNPQAAQNPQMRMMRFLPLLFVVFCIKFPAGVILYYAMSNVCRIIQQDLMYRFDPKVKALVAQEVQEVEANTRDIDEGTPRGKGYTPPRGAKQAPPAGQGASTGRMRFRDLLAAASEQQQKSQQEKARAKEDRTKGEGSGGAAKGGPPGGSPGGNGKALGKAGGANGSGDGSRSGQSGSNGKRGGNRPQQGRRNRKRRGR